jgi:hypothetical protein
MGADTYPPDISTIRDGFEDVHRHGQQKADGANDQKHGFMILL